MTISHEAIADQFLVDAKIAVKRALINLDPNPREDSAIALLRVLDALDAARTAVAKRWPDEQRQVAKP